MTINQKIKEKIVLALDVDTVEQAKGLITELKDYVGVFKVGLQFYTANGGEVFEFMKEIGAKFFFDLNLLDIPNTVKKASENIVSSLASFYNLHAMGGAEMMKQSVEGARAAAEETGAGMPVILAVTVLTSINDEVLNNQLKIPYNSLDYVATLAKLAKDSGMTGVVASVNEAKRIKEVCGNDFKVLCPGIRPEWSIKGDQKRPATPAYAIEQGADWLVIGRAVTAAENRLDAMKKIYDEIEKVI